MARSFNGSSDLASFSPSIAGFNVLSLSFWMLLPTNPTSEKVAIVGIAPFGGSSFDFEPRDITNGIASMTMTGPPGFWVDTFTQATANVWHHYLAIYSRVGPTNTLYIDGLPITMTARVHNAGSYGNFADSGPWYLMDYPTGGAAWFTAGSMAELAAWGGVTITASEAVSLAAGASPVSVHPDGLTFYVPMHGGDSPEPDYSGNKYNATLTGTSYVPHPRVQPGILLPNRVGQGGRV